MAKFSISNTIKYLLFFSLGILIFYFVYRDQDPKAIWDGVKEFKLEWILLSFVFSIISHIMRAFRWRMLIEPLGYSPGRLNTFLAILVMYLANFAFPRLGEVSRCGVLTKYEKVPFAPQIGTVVTERIFDFIVLLLILLVVLLTQFNVLTGFIDNNRDRIGFDSTWITSPVFWIIIIGFIILGVVVLYLNRDKIKSLKWVNKLIGLLKKFAEGLLSVRKLKKPGLFIFYTLGIYVMYFLMTYSVFLGYEASRDLGFMAVFAVLAMGSVGMVIPVQGGLGTYHFFVIQTLIVLGVARAEGELIALVLHGSTTVFMIFIGLLALLALPLVNKTKKPKLN